MTRTSRLLAASSLVLLIATGFAAHARAADAPARGAGPLEDADFEQRMAREHASDEPVPGAAAGDAAEEGVETRTVTYWADEGINGYLAVPSDGEVKGGLLVIQEWWGLNDNIRTMARRFAAAGYAALAVDLYEGEVASDRDGARALMSAAMENDGRLEDNLRSAHAYLTSEVGVTTIGSVGWCFGGGWSLRTAAMMGDSLDAAVIYYGRVFADERLDGVAAPVLGHFGSEDGGIPLDGVRAFESALEQRGGDVTIHVYEGAGHAFANPTGTRYQADAAELSWDRTLAFFGEHLGD